MVTRTGIEYDVFTVKYLDNGFYSISQRSTNMFLDVYGGEIELGANVQMFEENNAYTQQWSIETYGRGFKIRSRANSYYLDVENGDDNGENVVNGANVMTWAGEDRVEQLFGFIPYTDNQVLANGFYAISSAVGGYVVDDKYTANIQIGKETNRGNFYVNYISDGYYTLTEISSGLAVHAKSGIDGNFLTNKGNNSSLLIHLYPN
mgnify:CR=1 FL=1